MPHRGRRMTPEEPNRSGSRIVRHEALRKFAKPCGLCELASQLLPDPALSQAPLVPVGHSDAHPSEHPGPLVMHRPSSGCAAGKSRAAFPVFRISTS